MIYGASLLSYEEYDQALAMDGIAGQMADKDTRVQIITTNATRPYMSDLRVRQAVAYAIDKEELSQATSNGYEPAADMIVTRDTPCLLYTSCGSHLYNVRFGEYVFCSDRPDSCGYDPDYDFFSGDHVLRLENRSGVLCWDTAVPLGQFPTT